MAALCCCFRFVVLTLLQLVALINGSELVFESSPHDLKRGLSPRLQLNCSLVDTAVSSTIIGKRDVTHHDVIVSSNPANRDASQAADNILMLTSMVVMHDGTEVAAINLATDASVMDGSTNIKVTGKVGGTSSSTGYILLSITDPSSHQTGEFTCEASGVGSRGHGVTFTKTVEVTSSEPSMADLVSAFGEMRKKNEELEKKVEDLVQENADLKESLSELKNKSKLMVFFNARMKTNPHYTNGQEVVFDDVRDNKGNDYNGMNGHFVCTVPGYYHFNIGCVNSIGKHMDLVLYHNNSFVFHVHGEQGHTYESGANAGTLELKSGDVVNVRSAGSSDVVGSYCSFSGHLIEAI